MHEKTIDSFPLVSLPVDHRFCSNSSSASAGDFLALLKPRVMLLVVYSGIVGALIAPGSIHPFLLCLAILCIALGSGSAAAFNMWYDRDIDLLMERTQKRPIPAGKIAPPDALGFAIVLSCTAIMLMFFATNWITTILLVFSILFYDVVYTILLKRTTSQNIVIGGAAGAFPPIIGWTAITGSISLKPLVLFLIIFLWTPSHFWSLALFRADDYAKAGVPMLPVTSGVETTKKQILIYTFLLIAASMMPWVLAWNGLLYGVSACILNSIYLLYAIQLYHAPTPLRSLRLFKYSIAYLFFLLSALMLDQYYIF